MLTIRGFISHSFSDEVYPGGLEVFRTGIKKTVTLAEEALSSSSNEIKIEPFFDASDYGRPLPAQLRKQIKECDFLLADITTTLLGDIELVNENVMYEIGYAMSLGLPILVIRQQCDTPLPSDLKDILVASYTEVEQLPDLLYGPLAQIVSKRTFSFGARNVDGDMRISRTWFAPDTTEIHIICSPEPERSRFASQSDPNYLFIDNLEDRDALLEVSTFLSRQYPKANLIRHSSDRLPPDALSGNLVVLGGPGFTKDEGNSVTRRMLAALDSTVKYSSDNDAIMIGSSGELLCELNTDNSVNKDYGSLLAAANPFNPIARVILCHGVYTYGTLGAVLALSDNPMAIKNHLLLDELNVFDESAGANSFEAVFKVNVIVNGKISPPIIDPRLVRRLGT